MTTRKGPNESATEFSIGTHKKGNDGNMWKIITTTAGIRRWKKVSGNTNSKTKKNKKTKQNKTKKSNDISLEKLKQLKKQYNVETTGSKKEIAEGLYRVSGHNMDNKDLELIMPLLPQKEQKIIGKKINIRINNPITNYKGMWKPLPKPLNKMTRNELVHHLRSFKDAWEKNTGRNQDLSDERLKRETTSSLRNLLKWYYSDSSKMMAEDYLR